MHRSWRELFPLIFCGFLIAGANGCAEYNRLAPVSEKTALSGVVQVTDGFAGAGDASFSADQRWIVFRAVAAGQSYPRLYLAKIDTDSPQTMALEPTIGVTQRLAQSMHGSFSHDGLSLIFSSNSQTPEDDPTRARTMRIFRADGWEGMVAMTDRSKGIDLAQKPIETGPGDCNDCTYSPDGKWICFSTGHKGSRHLALMHADGSHLIQLTDASGDCAQPAFSPDGKSLVYISAHDAATQIAKAQILLADFAFDKDKEITGLKGPRALTHDDENNINPAWYPTGSHLIYATSRHGRDNYELYVMDRDGRRKTRITFSAGADLMPAFSPDGKLLLWTSKRSKDGSDELIAARFTFPPGSY